MHDHSSKPAATPASDHLTDMLRGLRLDGVEYGRCEMTAPWAIAVPQQKAARFYFIAKRGCWLLTPSKEWLELRDGDAVLLPRGAEHVLASAPDVEAFPLANCQIRKVCGNIFDVKGGGDGQGAGESEPTLIFSGSMTFNVDAAHPLLRMMPDLMQMFELAKSEPGIAGALCGAGPDAAGAPVARRRQAQDRGRGAAAEPGPQRHKRAATGLSRPVRTLHAGRYLTHRILTSRTCSRSRPLR
jgi:hypothetical protein